jgi:hypothetical protein
MESFDAKRRAFLRALSATTAALVAGGCGGGGGGDETIPPGAAEPASNVAPVWVNIPTVTFTRGIASSFSLESFATDANGDALAITMNAVVLPAGVTFDGAGKRLVYDGIGAVASASGLQMTADDGR